MLKAKCQRASTFVLWLSNYDSQNKKCQNIKCKIIMSNETNLMSNDKCYGSICQS